MNKLEYMAARLAFDSVTAEEIWFTVDTLLANGTYSEEFIAIIDAKPPRLADVLPPFLAYLRRDGVEVPDKDHAVWQIIGHHLSQIVSGAVRPLDGLNHLISDVYWRYDFHSPTKRFLGDSHGIEHLIGLYWGSDDMQERPDEVSCNGKYGNEGFQELEKEILNRSRDWLNEFANKTLERTLKGSAL